MNNCKFYYNFLTKLKSIKKQKFKNQTKLYRKTEYITNEKHVTIIFF